MLQRYLFLDDIFQPSPMLFGVCIADDLFQSRLLVQSSPVQRLFMAINSTKVGLETGNF